MIFGIYFASIDTVGLNLQNFARFIIPDNIWEEFNYDLSSRETRITIWTSAIKLIKSNPLIGLGAGSFAFLYDQLNGVYAGHAHNLPLEISYNYGIPISLLLMSYIVLIIYLSFKKLIVNNSFKKNIFKTTLYERAWWTSFLIIFLSNMFDVVNYDGRLGLIFWILLSGLVQYITCEIDLKDKSKLNNL
tara:strand:- start:47 stop:613 length:567 start_codon:yes stop_codon:yes gene_type:complete